MTPALVIKDAAGRVMLDSSMSIGRILGYVDVRYDTNPSGTFSAPGLSEGVVWAFIAGSPAFAPIITASGWLPHPQAASVPSLVFRIFFGTY